MCFYIGISVDMHIKIYLLHLFNGGNLLQTFVYCVVIVFVHIHTEKGMKQRMLRIIITSNSTLTCCQYLDIITVTESQSSSAVFPNQGCVQPRGTWIFSFTEPIKQKFKDVNL